MALKVNEQAANFHSLKKQIIHDITVLSETWKCDHSKNIEGYSNFEMQPQKAKGKSGRASGGIIVYYKSFLEPYIEVLKRSKQYAWIKLSGKIFNNLNSDVYLCVKYKPPLSSPYSDEHFYNNLAFDILKFRNEHSNCIFIGDFNSRTGRLEDHIDISDRDWEFKDSVLGDNRHRNNLDTEVNESGKQLIQFCKSFGLRILNGRTTGDSLGDFTHFNNNDGQSAVDLALVSEKFFNNIQKFMIFPQLAVTDHCKIAIEIPIMIVDEHKTKPYKWINLKLTYKCTKTGAQNFSKAFETEQIKSEIKSFEQLLDSNDTELISSKF